jgi:hypothetical protein
VRIEQRVDGSVAIRSSRSLRIVVAALGVAVRTRLETDADERHRVLHRTHRVELVTRTGALPLTNAWTGDERAQARVAGAIRSALGKSPRSARNG